MAGKSPYLRSIRVHLVVGLAAVVALAGGVGGWAATMRISGAVIAPGQVVVDDNVKKVQHTEGGTVGELRVRDGDEVKAGDIVLRLDGTQVRANLLIYSKGLDELVARQAREEAEMEGVDAIEFPEELTSRADDPDVKRALRGERREFQTRKAAREGQKSQLRQRIGQIEDEIVGYRSQITAKDSQIKWVTTELNSVTGLWEKGLAAYSRVAELQREKAALEGERAQLTSAIAQAAGRTTETGLQILQIGQDMRTEVGRDLGSLRPKIAELRQRKVAAQHELSRLDIRAPQGGTVFQLQAHAAGEVIRPGEPIMLIVPNHDALSMEIHLRPQDIDQVRLGQPVTVNFTAFDMRTTPQILGQISRIAADVTVEQQSGKAFYSARVNVQKDQLARLNGLQLIPGMPCEAFVQTSPRTVLSFLTKPFLDQMGRTFREN